MHAFFKKKEYIHHSFRNTSAARVFPEWHNQRLLPPAFFGLKEKTPCSFAAHAA